MEYTPAPWEIGLVDHQHDIENCPNIKLDMPGNDAVYVTGTHRFANARLIAAAPEMYEALQNLLDATVNRKQGMWTEGEIAVACKVAQTAIAKAEGH